MASPLREHNAWLSAALAIDRKRDAARRGTIHLEPCLGEGQVCGRTLDGNDYCTLADMHQGPCNWSQGEDQ